MDLDERLDAARRVYQQFGHEAPHTAPEMRGMRRPGSPTWHRWLAVACIAVVALVIAAGIVTSRHDEGTDLITQPGPSDTQSPESTSGVATAVPRLAPSSQPWHVISIEPSSYSRYEIGFGADDDLRLEVVGFNPPNPESATELPVVVNGRSLTGQLDLGTNTIGVAYDADIHVFVSATTSAVQGLDGDARTSLLVQAIESLEPIPESAWIAALSPPTASPALRLGIPASAGAMQVVRAGIGDNVQSVLPLDPAGETGDADYSLVVRQDEMGRTAMERFTGTPAMVRGTTAVLHDDPASGSAFTTAQDPSSPGLFSRAVAWEEEGAVVVLAFTTRVTVEEAIAFADSLVVLDPQEWAVLLSQ